MQPCSTARHQRGGAVRTTSGTGIGQRASTKHRTASGLSPSHLEEDMTVPACSPDTDIRANCCGQVTASISTVE
jgi:hypothetical protein